MPGLSSAKGNVPAEKISRLPDGSFETNGIKADAMAGAAWAMARQP